MQQRPLCLGRALLAALATRVGRSGARTPDRSPLSFPAMYHPVSLALRCKQNSSPLGKQLEGIAESEGAVLHARHLRVGVSMWWHLVNPGVAAAGLMVVLLLMCALLLKRTCLSIE